MSESSPADIQFSMRSDVLFLSGRATTLFEIVSSETLKQRTQKWGSYGSIGLMPALGQIHL